MADEFLWPARNVAEFAYCPRLFYYMQVEGVFVPSGDTERGQVVHKRVNKPSAAKKGGLAETSADAQGPDVVRSLALTSTSLRLTATLDLAQISGRNAVPVEYRKGRPRYVAITVTSNDSDEPADAVLSRPEPWPTDRVQVGLQAILLEEAGYTVTEAVLYYSEEQLRLTIPVTKDIKAEALATLEAAKACANGPRPLPLVNDAKCPRCSLQPVCLPDEVNQERASVEGGELAPRRMWPPRDDGIHVVTQSNGVRVGVRGMELRVTEPSGAVVKKMPLANVESLALVGSVQISTQAVHTLADRGVPVAFLSSAGRLIGMIDPLDSVSAEVRKAQVRRLDDEAACLELSRALVVAKIANQRTLLMRNHEDLPKGIARDLSKEMNRAHKATSVESLRGHEGQAAALYFESFAGMFKGALAAEFDSNGRQRRPPPDPINCCLSFAYTMLTHECVTAVRLARLEPTIGAYHTSRPGRPALALDLMEPFRPLVADSVAVTTFNRGELTEGHFMRTSSGCALTDAGRQAFFAAYGRRMEMEVTHPMFGYRLSYRRMLTLHARMIGAWLVGDVTTLVFLTTR